MKRARHTSNPPGTSPLSLSHPWDWQDSVPLTTGLHLIADMFPREEEGLLSGEVLGQAHILT